MFDEDVSEQDSTRAHPAFQLAVAAVAAASLTGAAVAGVTWAVDRTSAPPSASAPAGLPAGDTDRTMPSAETPGWAETLEVPGPVPGAAQPGATGTAGPGATPRTESTRRQPAAGTGPATGTGPAAGTAAPVPSPSQPLPEPSAEPSAEPSVEPNPEPSDTGAGPIAVDPPQQATGWGAHRAPWSLHRADRSRRWVPRWR